MFVVKAKTSEKSFVLDLLVIKKIRFLKSVHMPVQSFSNCGRRATGGTWAPSRGTGEVSPQKI